jgi:Spy/CpxP family protein refolding chaperone
MKKKLIFLLTLLSFFFAKTDAFPGRTESSHAENEHSPYAGQETRKIKSLSMEEIEGYLSGRGMGFAKAGELNHYPGPRHVLDLAEKLDLSEGQLAKTREIYSKMHEEAVQLGKLIVEKEGIVDNLFADKKIDEIQLRSLALQIGSLRGELRFVHLRAHLEMRRVLSLEQINKYDRLRGYKPGGSKDSHRHHHHGQY